MSATIHVDCKNLACPHPVIKTKKALDSINQGIVIAFVDNDIARENVMLFAKNAGFNTDVEKKEGGYQITITKGEAGPIVRVEPEPSTVYLVTSNMLGQGPPDLGEVLMKSLMLTLTETDPPPQALLFLNSGILMTCEGSSVIGQLHSLSLKGTVLISCGTCLEYYKLKNRLKAGRVGNMLEINGYLSKAAKVITIS